LKEKHPFGSGVGADLEADGGGMPMEAARFWTSNSAVPVQNVSPLN